MIEYLLMFMTLLLSPLVLALVCAWTLWGTRGLKAMFHVARADEKEKEALFYAKEDDLNLGRMDTDDMFSRFGVSGGVSAVVALAIGIPLESSSERGWYYMFNFIACVWSVAYVWMLVVIHNVRAGR